MNFILYFFKLKKFNNIIYVKYLKISVGKNIKKNNFI